MLVLPIQKKWFNMILSGQKKEEYREIKTYWTKRLNNEFDKMLKTMIPSDVERNLRKYPQWLTINFRNGYSKNSPIILCKCKIKIGIGKQEWGAEKRKRILHFRNIRDIGGAEC